MKPESLMMSHGYNAKWSENSIKSPIFQTSTFSFNTSEEGKRFFEVAYGLKPANEGEKEGLIYSRMNNPNAQIAEERLCLWDKTEECALFSSGMAAISSAFFTFLRPGDCILYSTPLYGGSISFIQNILVQYGIKIQPFPFDASQQEIEQLIEDKGIKDSLKMIYIESPANPTNALLDISICANLAKKLSNANKKVLLAMDNTYLGPYWQNPAEFGVDLVLYSATKYIGGHSDIVAGACLGTAENIKAIKSTRAMFGGMIDPHTAWLIQRSLETMAIRCKQQEIGAMAVAKFLQGHKNIKRVMYPGLPENTLQEVLLKKQCKGSGAMISFEVNGGEAEAFKFLNGLKLVKLAVSLGSTESLAQHPYTMTHSAVPENEKLKGGITSALIRLSVGVEAAEDLIQDLESALNF